MTRLLTLILCALAVSAQGATHYVRNAATGTGDGSDWVNAYIGLSAFTPVRGDTYLIADGSYSGKIFTTPVSGTTYIYFKRATISNHGTSTGWNDSYAGGQAIFSASPVFDLRTSYLDFDGATGSGTSGYGILLNVNDGAPNSGGFQVYNGLTADHIRINHIEIKGTGPQTATQSTRGFYIHGNSVNDWQVINCYSHEHLEWIHTLNLNNSTFDHCYFQNCGSSTAQHGNGFSLTGDSITFSYCTIENMLGTSNTTYFEPQGTPTSNLNIYGCVIRATSPNERTTQWSFISTASISTVTGHAYNNTIYALHGIDPGIQAAGPGFVAENNVWQGCVNNPTFAGAVTADHNILNSGGVTFINAAAGDFHLASDTPITWLVLGSPYNSDPDGVARSSSVGAYQFTGAGSPGSFSFQSSAYSQSETVSPVAVTVQRVLGSSGAVSVSYSTSDGTAIAGVNYVAKSGTLTWPSGNSSPQQIQIQLINASMLGTKAFTVNLEGPTGGATVISPSTSTVTIIGSGAPPANPINSSPPDQATGVSLTPTCSIVSYSDPGGRAQTGFEGRIWDSTGTVIVYDVTLGAVTSFPVPAGKLSYGTDYQFDARVQNSLGLWSGFSAKTRFTTLNGLPQAPTNLAPSNGATGLSLTPNLTLSAFVGVSPWDGSQFQVISGNTVVWDSNQIGPVATTTVGPNALAAGASYLWQGRFHNPVGWGRWSERTTFTTAPAPQTPVNVSPAMNEVNVSTTPALQLSSYFSGLPQTDAQIVVTFGGGIVWNSGSLGATNKAVVPFGFLSGGQTYGWMGRFRNGQGWGGFSAGTSFSTTNAIVPPPPIIPTNATIVLIIQNPSSVVIQGGTIVTNHVP